MLPSVQTAVRYERLKDDFDWPIEAGGCFGMQAGQGVEVPSYENLGAGTA